MKNLLDAALVLVLIPNTVIGHFYRNQRRYQGSYNTPSLYSQNRNYGDNFSQHGSSQYSRNSMSQKNNWGQRSQDDFFSRKLQWKQNFVNSKLQWKKDIFHAKSNLVKTIVQPKLRFAKNFVNAKLNLKRNLINEKRRFLKPIFNFKRKKVDFIKNLIQHKINFLSSIFG